jgi:hypothetical protein
LALLAVAALVFAACGNDSNDDAKAGGDTSTTLDEHAAEHQDSGDHDEHAVDSEPTATTEHDMDNMAPAKPLPLLPDGTIDPDGVDLSGVEGVTPEEQAYAEALLVRSLTDLPTWADYDQAIADGFKSIGDGPFTGEEHVIRYEWVEDGVILDPTKPESLVYKYETLPDGTAKRTLEAAMFILPASYTLETAPNDGGALMQYHNHQNLCFTTGAAPRVAGLTDADGNCAPPLAKGAGNIQIHVWIRANDCGPFAALKGVGGGQVAEGETVTCLSEHGSHSL